MAYKYAPKRQRYRQVLPVRIYQHQKFLLTFFGGVCVLLFIASFLLPGQQLWLSLAGISAVLWCVLFVQSWLIKRLLQRTKTLEQLRKMNPFTFEHYVAGLLRKQGYQVKVTPTKRDYGTDIIATKDGEKVVCQCKRYSKNNYVSSPEMQQFIGSMTIYGAQKGMYITTSTFSNDAKMLARKNNVELVDQDRLVDLVRKTYGKSER